MKRKTKGILFSVLVVVCTAVVFFFIGYAASFLHGPAYTMTTEIEYVTPSESATSTELPTEAETTTATETSATPALATATESATTAMVTTAESVNATESVATTAPTSAAGAEKINLNTATMEQLMTIPGIGEVYALRIIEYREQFGGFTHLEQLKEIKGIGEKRYAQWSPYFTLS